MRLRDNRYIYRVYKMMKEGTPSQKREAIHTLLSHISHLWDYLDEIRRNHYVFKPKWDNTVSFYLPYVYVDAIQKIIARNEDYYERDELDYIKDRYVLSDGLVYCDIGANIGNHTLYFAKECNAKKIYAFEPVADTFSILERNIEINKIKDKVVLYNRALGDGASSHAKIMSFNPANIGGTTIGETLDDSGNIKMMRLDDLQIKEKIGFIKIDTEGFELKVLKGCKELIKRDQPIIYVEVKLDNILNFS